MLVIYYYHICKFGKENLSGSFFLSNRPSQLNSLLGHWTSVDIINSQDLIRDGIFDAICHRILRRRFTLLWASTSLKANLSLFFLLKYRIMQLCRKAMRHTCNEQRLRLCIAPGGTLRPQKQICISSWSMLHVISAFDVQGEASFSLVHKVTKTLYLKIEYMLQAARICSSALCHYESIATEAHVCRSPHGSTAGLYPAGNLCPRGLGLSPHRLRSVVEISVSPNVEGLASSWET